MDSHRQTLSEALAELRGQASARSGETRYVADWRSQIPSTSRWEPGFLGDPACPMCLGLGVVHLDLPVGHPRFGKLVTCDCAAQAVERERTAFLTRTAALGESDLKLRWRDVVRHTGNGPAIDAVSAVLKRGYGWVYLHGAPGPGKTLILKTAIAETLAGERGAVYAVWADILDHLRAGYRDDTFDERLERWRTAGVLAIDEFGRAKESEWTAEAEVKLLDRRYDLAVSQRKGVTIFASNFPAERYSDWLVSRLRDGRNMIVAVSGDDMRPAMEWEQEPF